MKKRLKHLDEQIEFWQKIVELYPLSEIYRDTVVRLKNQRDLEASKIGKVDKK